LTRQSTPVAAIAEPSPQLDTGSDGVRASRCLDCRIKSGNDNKEWAGY
jgi:hypothetical protein